MKCPNCFADIKYKERSNNQCLKCNGTFVFEPKTHPLGLTDGYFSRTVDKLSDNGEIYFTLEQFHFALNRKKIRQSDLTVLLIIFAIITSVSAFFIFSVAAIFVVLFWTCFFIYRFFYKVKIVSLQQTLTEFKDDVLQPWKKAHKNLPSNLVMKQLEGDNLKDKLRGFLLCDTNSTATFLIANKMEKSLGLSVSNDVDFPRRKHRTDLPIFVLHDASRAGFDFVEQIKRIYENDREIFDIGLRPNDAKVFELPVLRQKSTSQTNVIELTIEENKWLNQGFYTPLFVLKPSHLLEFVTDKIERNFVSNENL